ncbi:hypothetical protein, partial [Bacillus sp. WP8]|uniref:hypothetical protein n=1 Tax=Bacillus sp. WP8 TaxID=756828 RepID=UPI001C92C990
MDYFVSSCCDWDDGVYNERGVEKRNWWWGYWDSDEVFNWVYGWSDEWRYCDWGGIRDGCFVEEKGAG